MPNGQILLPLPKDKLPDEWNNESRMNVLFAPFRNRSVNPKDWDFKFSFWQKLIVDTCIYNKIYTFTLEEMQKLFNINGRSPACLSEVLDEMYKRGELQQLDQFLQKPLKTWSSWITDTFMKRPFVWSYNKMKDTLKLSSLGTVVNIPAIVSEGVTMQSTIPDDFKNRIVSLKEVLYFMNVDDSKSKQIKLILHHLMCLGIVDMYEIKVGDNPISPDNILIKFKSVENKDVITEVEVSIHILKQTEKNLLSLVEQLEKEEMDFIDQAKSFLAKGHRQMAKNSLRKKHEVDKRLQQKANTLHNVQTLLLKLCDSSVDAEVLESYQLALSTLKKNFTDTGLSEDSVGDVMSELGSTLDMHDDIQSMLAQSLTSNDEDLEDELALLISENSPPTDPSSPSKPIIDTDDKELERRFEDLKLPDVPSDSLLKSKVSL